jgi:hypothetical protein
MSNIVEFVKQQEPLFCGALTEQTVTWAKESQFAIQYFQKNDFSPKQPYRTLPAHRTRSSTWQPLASR